MDFFAAEARAKKRTSRLLVLFGLAVAGTVLSGYFGALLITRVLLNGTTVRHAYGGYSRLPADGTLWHPQLFGVVALGTLAVIAIASLYKWAEFRGGGSAVAESVGARRVDPHTTDPREHQLLNVVEEMAIASGLPVPAVYILDDEAGINAFAAGLTTSDSVVTVTRGTLEKLRRDELQGVVAHEFSHILNGDMRMNMRVSAVLFGILVIGLAGRAAISNMTFIRVGGSRKEGDNRMVVLAIGVGLMVVGYVGYFFGRLIQASVSRQREFLADASAVQFTRNPEGVTGALKKIGGYAIGSSLDTHRAAGISHFFFAQAFESHFGGLWATHPPLPERIRAIDPAFDGNFPEPPQVVDVATQPWSRVSPAPATVAPSPAPALGAAAALGAAMAAAGSVTAENTDDARSILEGIPPSLRTAARSPHDAPILVYGLLLDGNPEVRRAQLAAVARRAGGDALETLERLDPALLELDDAHRLPALQLALPALKALPASALGGFADTLDDLVQADGRVTTFEFALQRLVLRALSLSRAPSAAVAQIFSFQAVASEISVVLSALAHASSDNAEEAQRAFAEGASQLKLVQASLAFLPDAQSGLEQFDAALDKLATASGPIKQRLLMAGAHVVGADGVVLVKEAELLRAVAAALDVPVPPVAVAA